jgi:hypothetical protein
LACLGFFSAILFHVRALLYKTSKWRPLRARIVKSSGSWSNPILKWLGEYGRGEHISESLTATRNLCLIVGAVGIVLGALAFVV